MLEIQNFHQQAAKFVHVLDATQKIKKIQKIVKVSINNNFSIKEIEVRESITKEEIKEKKAIRIIRKFKRIYRYNSHEFLQHRTFSCGWNDNE